MRCSLILTTVAALAVTAACGVATRQPSLVLPDAAPEARGGDTLKVHMRSGELFMFRHWSLDTASRRVIGTGHHFTVLREERTVTDTAIAIQSVALFETNRPGAAWPFGLQGVAVLTTLGAYVSAVCLADPKACFGSCPTFYIEGDVPDRVHAEGFSASVASVLEERDVDAMPRANIRGRRMAILMKNEAWETHVVRSVNLLVAPRAAGSRVFATPGDEFRVAFNLTEPATCTAATDNCRATLRALDGVERRSSADSSDLAARETIELTFPAAGPSQGLVLTARNSLITTYLFYQAMAYAGSTMGALVASLERGGRAFARSHFSMARMLGGIDVDMLVAGEWVAAGTFGEPGPIAADTKVIPLPANEKDDSTRIRLRLAKGNWRLDWVALAALGDRAAVVRVPPAVVERGGSADVRALAALTDSSRALVSMPGDEFRIVYELPDDASRLEIFLESQGYYYEWQREAWLAEENPLLAAMVVTDPAELLRRLAPEYKRAEGRMEQLFWESRFNRHHGGPDARP